MATGSADKFLRVFKINEETDCKFNLEKVYEVELDSEVNHVSYSPEGDLIAAGSNSSIYLYRSKKNTLFKKLDLTAPDLPKRTVFCLYDNLTAVSVQTNSISIQSIAPEVANHISSREM